MAVIQVSPGSPLTVGAGNGQKLYAYNAVGTSPAVVAPDNPLRQSITFHNPGVVDILVAPVNIQNTGSDAPLSPSIGALGGCFRVYANGGSLIVTGECQRSWQAFATSGTTNPLTVMETNC